MEQTRYLRVKNKRRNRNEQKGGYIWRNHVETGSEGYYRFVQAESFGATYGGGEANVAVSWQTTGWMPNL